MSRTDYVTSESNSTIYAEKVKVDKYGYIVSRGSSNTIYLTEEVGAAPSYGTNYIFGIDKYNLLQYFESPKAVSIDAKKGVVVNGWGGLDYFQGISGFQGSQYSDLFAGSSKDEIFYTGSGADTVIGGGGWDKVTFYSQPSTDFAIEFSEATATFTLTELKYPQNIKILKDIDQIDFGDKSISALAYVNNLSSDQVSNLSWDQISSLRKLLSESLENRPVGFNLNKIWYENFQVDISKFCLSAMSFQGTSNPDTAIGYGTFAINQDRSITVVSGGWKPDEQASGRLYQAIIREGIAVSADIKAIEGATHFYAYRDLLGNQKIIGLGSDEGKLKLDYSVKDRVGNVVSGNSKSTSIVIDPITLNVKDDPNLVISAHNSHSFDYNNDKLLDFIINDNQLIINQGEVFSQLALFTKEPNVGGMALGWLGKQSDETFAFVIGDPSPVEQFIPPERNVIVYTDSTFQKILKVQVLPIPIFEDPVYQGLPEVYLGWDGSVGTSHDMNIRIRDINRDGLLDILVGEKIAAANLSSGIDASFGAIQILIAQKDGSFSDETRDRLFNFDTTFAGPHHFEFHDINGDGFEDILTAEYNARGLYGPSEFASIRHAFYALINDGTGHFIAAIHQQFAMLQTPDQIKAQFGVDADGKPFWVGWEDSTISPVVRVMSLSDPLYTGPDYENPAIRGAPGFNEFYYLLSNPDVRQARLDGQIPDGLTHFLAEGRAQGRMPFAPDARVQGSYLADLIQLREGSESAFGYDGNDVIQGGAGSDILDGGDGIDTAIFEKARSAYKTEKLSQDGITIWKVTDLATGDIDELRHIEKLEFAKASVAGYQDLVQTEVTLDVAGTPAVAYRLYKAAFARDPDLGGLGYWISALQQYLNPNLSPEQNPYLLDVAKTFVESPEFKAKYGADVDNATYIRNLYKNALGRDPLIADPVTGKTDAGYTYWVGVLDAKAASRSDLFVYFSESAENKAAVAPIIATGVEYVPWVPPGG